MDYDDLDLIPRRSELQKKLEDALGSSEVFFNPGETTRLSYPCILYSLKNMPTTKANDNRYSIKYQYDVTVIEREPDLPVARRLMDYGFKYISFDRTYVADNLIHSVYQIYF